MLSIKKLDVKSIEYKNLISNVTYQKEIKINLKYKILYIKLIIYHRYLNSRKGPILKLSLGASKYL